MKPNIDETIVYGYIALKGLTLEFEKFYKWVSSLPLPKEI